MKIFLLVVVCLYLVIAEEEKEKKEVGTVIGIDLGTTYSWLVYIFDKLLFIIVLRVYFNDL